MKNLLFVLLLLGLVSCSGSKSTDTMDADEAGIELADSDEFAEPASEDVIAGNLEEPLFEEAFSPVEDQAQTPVIAEMGEQTTYTVEKNETLMIIAFKIYGDYGKWKDIAALNQDVLKGGSNVMAGMQIKYNKPAQEFNWAPSGNPYLIKSGDTLGTISNDTYGTIKYWKDIWQNNKPLIKDPNKIFAGFTIYTPMIDDGRDVANDGLDGLEDL